MYPAEIYLPVTRDTLSYQQRRRSAFEDAPRDISHRQFDDDLDHMRDNFLKLKPSEQSARSPRFGRKIHAEPIDRADDTHMYGVDKLGSRTFQVRFDVDGFNPDEIKVSTEKGKVIVNAAHTEKKDNSSVTKEFRRQVDVPQNVDPGKIACVLSTDGVLTLEAPLHAPSYQSVSRETAEAPASPKRQVSSPPTTFEDAFRGMGLESSHLPKEFRDVMRAPVTRTEVIEERGSAPITTVREEHYSSSAPHHVTHHAAPGRRTIREERITTSPRSGFVSHTSSTSPRSGFVSHTSSTSPRSGFVSHTSSSPSVSSSSLLHNDDGFSTIQTTTTGPSIVEEDGVRKMKITISSFNFAPEELTLKTQNQRLHVSAVHEEKSGGRTMSKQFNRDYDLPSSVDPNKVSAYMTEDGSLVIEAPVKVAPSSKPVFSVKITHE